VEPSAEGTCKAFVQAQVPELVRLLNKKVRVEGQAQLVVPAMGPALNLTERQLKHKLPIITATFESQMHCPPLSTKGVEHTQD
jgi:hypothetical protein